VVKKEQGIGSKEQGKRERRKKGSGDISIADGRLFA
jgi:hypothetical protein